MSVSDDQNRELVLIVDKDATPKHHYCELNEVIRLVLIPDPLRPMGVTRQLRLRVNIYRLTVWIAPQ